MEKPQKSLMLVDWTLKSYFLMCFGVVFIGLSIYLPVYKGSSGIGYGVVGLIFFILGFWMKKGSK